LVIA
jgi:uncharacterized protein YxjI